MLRSSINPTMGKRQKCPGQCRALNLCYQGKNLIFTFDVDDTNFSKEVSITENSKLFDPIICHHCKLSFFDDVHFVSYISFFADIFPWTEYLQGKKHQDIACLYFTLLNEACSALLFIAPILTDVQTSLSYLDGSSLEDVINRGTGLTWGVSLSTSSSSRLLSQLWKIVTLESVER